MDKKVFYEDCIAYVIRPRKSWRNWRLYVHGTKVIMRIEDEIIFKSDRKDPHYHIERYSDFGLEASCDLIKWKDVLQVAGEKHKNLLGLAKMAACCAREGIWIEITKYDDKFLFVTDHHNLLRDESEWPDWLKDWWDNNAD